VGWLDPAHFPRIEDPADARLWSANARTVDGDWLALEGDGGVDLGARAQQIRDDLRGRQKFETGDLLAIQLDDRALFLTRWQQLLAQTLADTREPALVELHKLTAQWGGKAGVDAVDYRLVRSFRAQVIDAVLAPFIAPARERFPEFDRPSAQSYEAAVWALLQAKPAHLLDPQYASWEALLSAAATNVAKELAAKPGGLAARSWGERNTVTIRHPLSRALPGFLARFLDMPAQQLPGDTHMPRVQGADFGASERFAIAPGHEDHSYLMMPGGQSGHPLSPFHAAGHSDWANGTPTPLLPGASTHSLTLRPE
jgi:penicillin amidase